MSPRTSLPLLVGTLCLVVATACVSASRGPPAPYATGMDPRFPRERYVVGVGEGIGLEAARRQAITSIASQLRASLRASETIEARVATGDRDGSRSSLSSESVSQDIRVDVHFDRLQWIRFVDSHVEGGRTHVLAVLDRREAAELLAAEIRTRRDQLRPALDQLVGEENPRRLFAGLHALGTPREELAAAQQLLLAIERQPLSPPPELTRAAELDRKLAQLLAALRVAVCLESRGESEGILPTRLEVLLAGEGIQTVPCESEEPSFRLDGTLRARAWTVPPQPGAWSSFCTVDLDFRLVGADGWAEGGSEPGRRTGGATEAEACQNALRTLARDLGDRLGLSKAVGSR